MKPATFQRLCGAVGTGEVMHILARDGNRHVGTLEWLHVHVADKGFFGEVFVKLAHHYAELVDLAEIVWPGLRLRECVSGV